MRLDEGSGGGDLMPLRVAVAVMTWCRYGDVAAGSERYRWVQGGDHVPAVVARVRVLEGVEPVAQALAARVDGQLHTACQHASALNGGPTRTTGQLPTNTNTQLPSSSTNTDKFAK